MSVLYRCEYRWDRLNYDKYEIVRETRCGVWIKNGRKEKFVNLNARKKWACETEKEALEQFKHRKLRQIQILNGQLDFARIALHHVGVRFKETKSEIIYGYE